MIGGADKYMATCRRCFNKNVTIPNSPRPIGECIYNKENNSALSNTLKRGSCYGDKSSDPGNYEHDASAHMTADAAKKALFDKAPHIA